MNSGHRHAQIFHLPGKKGSPSIPIGPMPRLFIAVVQAVESDRPKSIRGDSSLRFWMLPEERIIIAKWLAHLKDFTVIKVSYPK